MSDHRLEAGRTASRRWAALAWAAAAWTVWAAGAAAAAELPPRRLAPGVLTVIPPAAEEGETFTGPVPLVELTTGRPELEWTPHFLPPTQTLLEKAKRVVLRREVWCLEFAFKPVRMIRVDVPQPTGKMQRKLIWYLLYRVRYLGGDLRPKPEEDRWGHTAYPGVDAVKYASRRFFPHFVLESRERNKAYLDRVIPAAKRAIWERERPGGELYDSVEITRVPIPLSEQGEGGGVWGVATWEDVDPEIDFFSIFVTGLTNAYQFEDPAGAYQPGDPPGTGRRYRFKTLQLNFWRPGDKLREHEEEIRYGVPVDNDPAAQQAILEKYGIPARLDYLWVYR